MVLPSLVELLGCRTIGPQLLVEDAIRDVKTLEPETSDQV